MAASPADPVAGAGADRAPGSVVAHAFGGVVLCDPVGDGPASYDHSGRRYVFIAAAGDSAAYALDVERRDAGLDPALAAALGGASLAATLQSWTLIEVAAKLQNQPAHLVLRQRMAASPASQPALSGITVQQPDHPQLWITVGRL